MIHDIYMMYFLLSILILLLYFFSEACMHATMKYTYVNIYILKSFYQLIEYEQQFNNIMMMMYDDD